MIKNFKYVLWILLFFLIYILFNSWENEKKVSERIKLDNFSNKEERLVQSISNENDDGNKIDEKEIIINTKLLYAKIDLFGGDIIYLVLKKYLDEVRSDNGVVLFDKSESKYFFAQSGFFEQVFSNKSKSNYNFFCNKTNYEILDGDFDLYLNLKCHASNLMVNKIYIFRNYSYEISVNFYLQNLSDNILSGKFYGFIKNKKDVHKSSLNVNRVYDGFAAYTKEKQYKKISYKDLDNKHFSYKTEGGWIASLDNYFLSAWIPNYYNSYNYNAEKTINNIYVLKFFSDKYIDLFPKEVKCIDSILFVGPKLKTCLNKIRKGLDLSIDYGIFWPIAVPIFLMLSKTFNFVNNWGLSIIIITFLIKILFFHLSSMSYRSMGNLKKVQPKMDLLKDRYKDDKRMLSQAMMELYRKEKVNPLSGCLPVLIQIPVFISLYYVLLESVELRHASFYLWIIDLSSKDPYYILPILMCITMFIQQKLNPPVQDPIQAKVIMFMPFLFLFLFLQFPSGLILYWVVNNILSILQQWLIIRTS
ncbi:MAG TPA: membrane protein insertase YidC [Candidatus Azoamicus sp. MARI]